MHPARALLFGTTVAAMLVPLAGCATAERPPTTAPTATPATVPTAAPTSATPSAPAARPPTATPTVAPDKPTDPWSSRILAGHITRGGSGPCYGLVTDDGREYALYGPGAGTFPRGTRVGATIALASGNPDCGPGTPVTVAEIIKGIP